MELIFSYGAGLLTLINPCVLPVLPLVIAAALRNDSLGPIALASGLSVSFVVLGVLIASVGPAIGIDTRHITNVGAVLMILFGCILIVPSMNVRFAGAAASLSARADQEIGSLNQSGFWGQFISGTLLGAVWSPCIGPTLGGAISLASQGQSLIWVTAIMVSFALGVSTVILILGYGTREALQHRQYQFRKIAEKSKWILSIMLIGLGITILTGLNHRIENWLIDLMPVWLQDLSVSL